MSTKSPSVIARWRPIVQSSSPTPPWPPPVGVAGKPAMW